MGKKRKKSKKSHEKKEGNHQGSKPFLERKEKKDEPDPLKPTEQSYILPVKEVFELSHAFYPFLGGLSILLILNPMVRDNIFKLIKNFNFAMKNPLPQPFFFIAALGTGVILSLIAILLYAEKHRSSKIYVSGIFFVFLYNILLHSFNQGFLLTPFDKYYNLFLGIPATVFLMFFLIFSLLYYQTRKFYNVFIISFIAIVLFFVTPYYRLGEGNIPFLLAVINIFLKNGIVINIFFVFLFVLVISLFVSTVKRKGGAILFFSTVIIFWLPSWFIYLALRARQTVYITVSALTLLSYMIAVGAGFFLAGKRLEFSLNTKKGLKYTALASVFFLFFLFKVQAMLPSTTDENIYFYMAHLITQGKLPYKDFFFAHPPFHILIPALVFKITGFNLMIAKFIPVLAAMISGFFVYKIGEKTTKSFFGGLFSIILFFFAMEVLKASSNLTGINLTLMFLIAGVYYFINERYITSGVLLAISAHTGFYMIAVAMLFVVLSFFKRKVFLRFSLTFFAVFFAFFAIFYAISPDGYMTGVFKYHFLKPKKDLRMIPYFSGINPFYPVYALFYNFGVFLSNKKFVQSLYYHTHLYWGAVASLILFVIGIIRERSFKLLNPKSFFEKGNDAGNFVVIFLCFTAMMFEFSMFKERYDFYFTLILVFAAILTGYFLVLLLMYFSKLHRYSSLGAHLLPVGLLVFYLFWVPISAKTNRIFPSEFKNKGEKITYRWTDPPILKSLSNLIIKPVFWKDYRIKGDMEFCFRHYLWNKKLYFSKAYEIASYIKKNSKPDETITGASTVAPLLALLSNRRIAGDEVDTNSKRFKSGITSVSQFFKKICADNLKFIVAAQRSFFGLYSTMRFPVIREHFFLDKKFFDPMNRHFSPYPVFLYKNRGSGCNF